MITTPLISILRMIDIETAITPESELGEWIGNNKVESDNRNVYNNQIRPKKLSKEPRKMNFFKPKSKPVFS